MSRLEITQRNFIDTINHGPARLNPALFSGNEDRILLGLKAHANTINHARLVALEDIFPRTRAAIGHAPFNSLSRSYCETPLARASDSNTIGADFAAYLHSQCTTASVVDLARIEWAWLESYNAADAVPLSLSDLTMMNETDLLAFPVRLHPAARLVALTQSDFNLIEELGNIADAKAIMVTRPVSDVQLFPVDSVTASVFGAAAEIGPLCNLLQIIIEQGGEAEPLAPLVTLINAGALTR